jgi:hypothetical protein
LTNIPKLRGEETTQTHNSKAESKA